MRVYPQRFKGKVVGNHGKFIARHTVQGHRVLYFGQNKIADVGKQLVAYMPSADFVGFAQGCDFENDEGGLNGTAS
jgi:hypothetical protein